MLYLGFFFLISISKNADDSERIIHTVPSSSNGLLFLNDDKDEFFVFFDTRRRTTDKNVVFLL